MRPASSPSPRSSRSTCESLADVDVDDEAASAALRRTAVIKLNGGLGTSMGMDRAKSLLCVRKGWSFLDVIARQVLHLRQHPRRTAAADVHEQLPHVGRHHGRPGPVRRPPGRRAAAGVPAEPRAEAARRRPHPGQLPARPRSRVVPARPRRPLHRAAWHRPARAADRPRLRARLRLQLRQPRRRTRRADRRLVRRHRCAVRDRGRTPYAVRPQGRPLRPAERRRPDRAARDAPRPRPRTSRRSATSTGTASARPTTSGSTCARWPRRSTRGTASSVCR